MRRGECCPALLARRGRNDEWRPSHVAGYSNELKTRKGLRSANDDWNNAKAYGLFNQSDNSEADFWILANEHMMN
jgi:hypothetical protein